MQRIYFLQLLRTYFSSLLSGLARMTLANRLTSMIVLLFALAAIFAPTTWAAPVANTSQQTVPVRDQIHMPLVAKSIQPVNLTAGNDITEMEPAWSPDGTTIAFNGLSASIYTVSADGSQQKRVIGMEDTHGATWSPDGSKLAFSGRSPDFSQVDQTTDIYLLTFQPDGSTQLTALTHDAEYDQNPAWSPDGSKIVFDRSRAALGNDSAIYVVNVDGSHLRRLTQAPRQWDIGPIWSPDGSKIAFVRGQGGPGSLNLLIYVMDADGSNLTAVTTEWYNLTPVWSPDSSKLYFIYNREENTDIYVVNVDGTQMTNLTNDDKVVESYPQLSPDGRKLIYHAQSSILDGNGTTHLMLMNVDGSQRRNLVTTRVTPLPPAAIWSPDSKKIAYVDISSYGDDLFLINLGQ